MRNIADQKAKQKVESPSTTNNPVDEYQQLFNSFPTYSWDDIENYKHDPKDDLVGTKGLGLISRGGSFMLIGPTGHGKSVLMQQWAVCMAAGIPILGRIAVHKTMKILYYQSDNQLSDMHIDFPSIREHLNVKKDILRQNLIVKRVYSIAGPLLGELLKRDVAKHKPEMIIMDNYQSFIEGDINSTGVFQDWKAAVEPVMGRHGAALVVVAHTTKKTQMDTKMAVEPGDSVYLAAGTAALSNWVRTSAWLCMDGGATNPGKYKLVLGKNWQRAGLGKMDTGMPIRDLKIEHSHDFLKPHWRLSDNQNPNIIIKQNSRDRLLKAYKTNPTLTHDQYAEGVGVSRPLITKMIKELKKDGSITGKEKVEYLARVAGKK